MLTRIGTSLKSPISSSKPTNHESFYQSYFKIKYSHSVVDQSHRRPSQFSFSRTNGRQKAGTPTTRIFFALTLSKLFDIRIRVGPALHYFSQRSLLPLTDLTPTLSFVSSSISLPLPASNPETAINPDIGFIAALAHTTRACPHALAPPGGSKN